MPPSGQKICKSEITTPPSGNTLGARSHKKVDIIFRVLFYFLPEDSPSVILTNPNVFPSQVS